MVCNTDDDAEIGRAALTQIAGTLAEGVLVLNTDIAINELCESAAVGAPIVLSLWEHPEQLPALPCVAVDFAHAGALAARHLLELGHRDIGMLVGDGVSAPGIATLSIRSRSPLARFIDNTPMLGSPALET